MRSFVREPETEAGFNWRVINKLLPYLWAYRKRVGWSLALLVGAKLSGVTMPIALKHVVDGLDVSQQDVESAAMLVVPLAMLLAYGLLRFFNVFLSEMRDAVFSRVTERAQRWIGLDVFRHLHRLELDFHLSRRTGGLSRDIERGTRGVGFLLRFLLFNIIPTLLEILLVAGILLVQFNLYYSLITLVAVVVYIGFSVVATEWRTGFVREANLMDNQANTRAIDSLLNYETVKYFNNEEFEANRYDRNLQAWESARVKNRLSLAALNSGQAFIIAGGVTVMMVMAAYDVQSGAMTLGDLVMINAFMIQIFMPLNVLGFVYREIKASLADIERMFQLLEQPPKVVDKPNAEQLDPQAKSIRFENVQFHYRRNRPILKGISFEIPAGEKVAIVGRSGAGKSTLARLLFRFYDIQGGSIRVGDQSVADVTQHSLREAMGVVPQDTVLFNDSIYNNILYGRPDASHDEVEQAARLAHLSEFIERLPEGYETKVGERGLKVSGGEKQRIAIARVILKRPRILVFDEATSSLDSESEKAILKAIREVSADHTTMVIAHRLSTIVDADRIVVLDDGQVVEQGNHQQLLQQQGLYAQLWEMQQKQSDALESTESGGLTE